jgi:hypothetical protein
MASVIVFIAGPLSHPPSRFDVFLPSLDEGGAGSARPIRMGVDHCLFQDAEQIGRLRPFGRVVAE